MAKICCLCGKKVGVFEAESQYSQNQITISCCEKCAEHINWLIEVSKGSSIPTVNKKYIDESRNYIISTMKSNGDTMSTENKTFFTNLLLEVDEGIRKAQERKEEQERQTKDKEQRKQNFMVTTGYDFQGYSIKKYIDVVSCEYVIGTGVFSELMASFSDTFGTSSNAFSDKIAKAKQEVLKQMKDKSIDIEGNALIGIDFDILTFNNNMIAVSGNGTAVYVEES